MAKEKREVWNSKIGVVLAAAGSAVGLGNFLRFPGIAAQNGGGAFMVPYFFAFVFIALPLCWMEWSMGRLGGSYGHGSAPGVFDVITQHKKPWIKYLGVMGIVGGLGIFFYYVYIESWTLAYSFFAAMGKYKDIATPGEMGVFLESYQKGDGVYFNSRIPAYSFFLVTFVANFTILYHGIGKGIERFCKIAMPLLFIVAIILVVRVFTLGTPVNPEWNVSNGLGFLWNPDFSALKSAKVWLEAAGQVFFSISVGIGTLLTYASYMKSKDDVLTAATTSAFLNEFAELVLGASIVIPAAFIFFGPVGTTEAVSGGVFGLAFKTTPLIFKGMIGGPAIGFGWFFLLFIAGCTSSVSIIQPALSFLQDEFGFNRKRCIIVLAMVTFVFANLTIFGENVLGEMDFWFSSLGLPLFGFIEAIVFTCFFGVDKGWKEMHRNSQLSLPAIFKFVMRWCTPVFLFVILVSWFVTEGWKTILMIKLVDGEWQRLYEGDAFYWVLATRICLLSVFAATCWLVKVAWKSSKHRSNIHDPG
ncbi:MAG: sodium-dependent transporter [Kiritimatiellae bacterium]|jgi:NSS family neurotransmitter:Na+ symporter|nr:sodium-dependent transporter [Kiritimatiellia bacterium]